eukprot:TRINITY_DN3998_c0_g1_i1.p1 TRINITY_DN3998_c0_g1~~TRINITY_DN3998_c0_g1_i1.p1  ORF type:complete len:378 (-),score=105.01 TRINITY_DN3998_c0_g1_i1:69-1124(-)
MSTLDEEDGVDEFVEVQGTEPGYSVQISKRAIFSRPGTLLETILKNDAETRFITLQLNRIQMDLMASYFKVDKKPSLDFKSIYKKFCRETADYLCIPPEVVNNSGLDLALHIVRAIKPTYVDTSKFYVLKTSMTDLQASITDHQQTIRFKKSQTAQKLKNLIPGLEVKSVERETDVSQCTNKYFAHHVYTTTFYCKGYDGSLVDLVEEHVDTAENDTEMSDSDLCHGTEECSNHGISVEGETLVRFAPKVVREWCEFKMEWHGKEMEVAERMNDDSLPPYFLKKWRTVVQFLDVEPLRRIYCIPLEVSDESLCEWLQELSPWNWDIEVLKQERPEEYTMWEERGSSSHWKW